MSFLCVPSILINQKSEIENDFNIIQNNNKLQNFFDLNKRNAHLIKGKSLNKETNIVCLQERNFEKIFNKYSINIK